MESPIIQFEELQADANQLLRELRSPQTQKNLRVPVPVAEQLRRQQIERLRENIAVLRQKQLEFNGKMKDYIMGLERLIENLESGESAGTDPSAESEASSGGTHVRCVGCGSERLFPDVDVLVAMEPEEFLTRPTEVIVQRAGQLKKGYFNCPSCGGYNLTIKPR